RVPALGNWRNPDLEEIHVTLAILSELEALELKVLISSIESPSNFDQLRQLVQHNNDALREIIAAFEEKAALDFQYSKSLKKISANLHRVTHMTESDIDKGWTSVAEQFDVQATIHSNLGSALTDDVIQPLRSIQLTEAKTIRADTKDATLRKKRLLYESSKQLEKLEQSFDQQNNGERASLKKKRLEEQVKKQEETYIWETVDLEKQRRLYERKDKTLQDSKLAESMFDRHTNNLDIAVQATAADYIAGIQPSTAAVNHIVLTDVYIHQGDIELRAIPRVVSKRPPE
ncbi:hypothetical protein TELCIR_15225, partial [Teladorsagia circumcincta]